MIASARRNMRGIAAARVQEIMVLAQKINARRIGIAHLLHYKTRHDPLPYPSGEWF